VADPIEDKIFEMLGAKIAPGKSIAPEDVARAIDPEGWRRLLSRVKGVARALARDGRLTVLRHNKPADPNDFKGVWRMRLPLATDAPQPDPPQGDPG
jgi:hypothetical protein